MQQDINAWVTQAQHGDKDAFSKIVETHQVQVFNLCYRMLGNRRDAEDAAQETFLRAYHAIKRYDSKRKLVTWLLSIASNYCIDQHRKRKLLTISFDGLPFLDMGDKQPGVENMYELGEEQERVQNLLEGLKPKDRAAIILLYWYDYSYEEIASTLSLTASAVKSRLHRARQVLAEAITNQQDQSEMTQRTRHGSPAI